MPDAPADLVALARQAAGEHSLPEELVCAVCEHESSWNPWAVRFEPAFEQKYIVPMLPHMPPTEEMLRAVSFGLMQIMGETARELGYQGQFLTGLLEPQHALWYGCKKLNHCMDKMSGDITAALLCYNGGGDPRYPSLVMPLMAKYKPTQATTGS